MGGGKFRIFGRNKNEWFFVFVDVRYYRSGALVVDMKEREMKNKKRSRGLILILLPKVTIYENIQTLVEHHKVVKLKTTNTEF